jgi:hypothetical protein
LLGRVRPMENSTPARVVCDSRRPTPCGGGGGDGIEHTRQLVPALVTRLSHIIIPEPKRKLEGPFVPWKKTIVPAELRGTNSSEGCVLKEVAVRGLPMASAVGVIKQSWSWIML